MIAPKPTIIPDRDISVQNTVATSVGNSSRSPNDGDTSATAAATAANAAKKQKVVRRVHVWGKQAHDGGWGRSNARRSPPTDARRARINNTAHSMRNSLTLEAEHAVDVGGARNLTG